MNYEQLRNSTRPKENIKSYKEALKELEFHCKYIKEILKKYRKISKENNHESLCNLINEMDITVGNRNINHITKN